MGSRYTTEENNRLKKFIKDHETVDNNAELARMLKSYGMFLERSDRGLEIQIGKLKNPPKEEFPFGFGEQMKVNYVGLPDTDPITAFVEYEHRKLETLYNSLMNAVLTKATPYRNPKIGSITGIMFDYKAIKEWLYENEPNKVNAWMEEQEER